MAEVVFGTYLLPHNVDDFARHERECWDHWNGLDPTGRDIVARTVKSELERLLDTIDNWLPAAAKKVSGGVLEITVRISPDEIGVGLGSLNSEEKILADKAVAALSVILDDLKD